MKNRQRMILGLATLAVVGAGIWAWCRNSVAPEAAATRPIAASPFRAASGSAPQASAPPESTPEVTRELRAPVTPAAPDESTRATAAPGPSSVDTPEPPQQKFAHGSRAEPEQI